MKSTRPPHKSNNTASAQTPEDLLGDLRRLVAEAEKMTGESLGEHGADTLDSLRERFDAAHERISDLYENAKEKIVGGAKRTDEIIRTNPYRSIMVATGVGLLVGVLIGRRSR
jgi:ElaB/YqjD/DUF883 family membrane-anchored ribosome-binding protein